MWKTFVIKIVNNILPFTYVWIPKNLIILNINLLQNKYDYILKYLYESELLFM